MKKYLLFIGLIFCIINTKAQNSVGIFDTQSDVGKVLHKGSATFDLPNIYKVSGSGENIWFKKDEFHFVWKKLKGDFIVTTQPTLIGTGGNAHRKTGWMVRTSLDTSAAVVCLTLHGDGMTAFQFRRNNNMILEEIKLPILNPDIIQLERRGRSYFISVAKLGNPFWTVEVPDFDFPEELMVGLFVCAHDKNVVEQATFINTRIFTAVTK